MYKLLKKRVYLGVGKLKQKRCPVGEYFFANTKNTATGRSCANFKIVVFFKRDIQPRGISAKVQLNPATHHTNFFLETHY